MRTLRAIYDEHAGLQDRFIGTGRVTPELAAQLGLTGLAGRASGQAPTCAATTPGRPTTGLRREPRPRERNGDVAARVAVRFDEVIESLRLIRALCTDAARRCGARRCRAAGARRRRRRLGRRLARRGLRRARTAAPAAASARCHCHDPSWQNWPVLEHAVIGNIVPDFPLINKSFNLSYSGHDL